MEKFEKHCAPFKLDADGRSIWTGKNGSGASTASGSSGPQAVTDELDRNDPIPKKTIAAMSYGSRVRIARLW